MAGNKLENGSYGSDPMSPQGQAAIYERARRRDREELAAFWRDPNRVIGAGLALATFAGRFFQESVRRVIQGDANTEKHK